MKYLVVGSEGPSFETPSEAADVLENTVIPALDEYMRLEEKGKILAGGLPVGDRALVFMVDAPSNDELDRFLRGLPMWEIMTWEVTALQTFAGRAEIERENLAELKKSAR